MTIERHPEPTITRFATVSVGGLTADYTRLPPGTGPSITAGRAIGVVFTPQRRAAWRVGRGERRAGPVGLHKPCSGPQPQS